jgi:paraquat-inducible protein A
MAKTALAAGLARCPDCALLTPIAIDNQRLHCQRCGEHFYPRRQNSVQITWALLITSIIFFIPANLLPMIKTTSLGIESAGTLMDGIIHFIHTGTYFIAFVIFFASILVPVFKILAMTLVLLSVRKSAKGKWCQHLTFMFRIVRFIGRWSMLDIFVIAILVTLVHFGILTNIQAGPAATWFASVVVLTMLSAETFDSRLIWDKL